MQIVRSRVHIAGEILQVHPGEGVRVKIFRKVPAAEVFVKHPPGFKTMAVGDDIAVEAWEVETYTYTTVNNSSRTLKCFTCIPPEP